MGQTSSADVAEMAAAAQKVEATATDLRKIKSDIAQEASQLTSSWQGQAGSAFTRVHNEFDQELNKVLQALDTLQEKLVQTKVNYTASEQQQQESVNRIAGLLG